MTQSVSRTLLPTLARLMGLALALSVLVAVALPGSVEAQAWLSDRSRSEGPGFRVGDFELHPGIGVEIGWDSNLFFTSEDGAGTPFVDTGVLRATAHLLFATRGQQRRTEGEAADTGEDAGTAPPIQLRGGIDGTLLHFFAAPDRTNAEVGANARLIVLQGRPFSFTLHNDFQRLIRPFTVNVGTTGDGASSFGRIQNTGGLDLNFSSTGEVLKVRLGYRNTVNYFEGFEFRTANRMDHDVVLQETFRFLPQTALVHNTTVSVVRFLSDPDMPTALVQDGLIVSSRIGLNGAITNDFSILGLAGYTAAFYDTPPALAGTFDQEFETLLLQLGARWRISRPVTLSFGYERAVRPSFIGNYYTQDRGYANFQALVGGTFLFALDASVGNYDFGRVLGVDGMPLGDRIDRSDIRVQGSVFGEWRFTNWFAVNATARYTGNFSDFNFLVEAVPLSFIEPVNFNKFEIFLGTRLFY